MLWSPLLRPKFRYHLSVHLPCCSSYPRPPAVIFIPALLPWGLNFASPGKIDTLTHLTMAPHSSTRAWKIPWTEEPCRLPSMGWQRVGLRDFIFTFHFHALEKEMATHSSVLAWRIPGTGSLVGCHLWGRTESDTTEVT